MAQKLEIKAPDRRMNISLGMRRKDRKYLIGQVTK